MYSINGVLQSWSQIHITSERLIENNYLHVIQILNRIVGDIEYN